MRWTGGLDETGEFKIIRLAGAQKNIQNAQSFLEVQDGILTSAGKILNRMVELKGLSEDVMKNDSDKENYNREFRDLQMQIYDLAKVDIQWGQSVCQNCDERMEPRIRKFNDTSNDNTAVFLPVPMDSVAQ